MQTLLSILIPTLLLPGLLSIALYWPSRRYPAAAWGIALIWLPSLIWLTGWPVLYPAEANNWLWLLAPLSILIGIRYQSRPATHGLGQSLLLIVILFAITWPVLADTLQTQLLLELLTVLISSRLLVRAIAQPHTASPALATAISAAGAGISIALAGSLLIGQLVIALATVLSAFVIAELLRQPLSVPLAKLIPLQQLYLSLLVIARVYAELPLGPSALLLGAILGGTLIRHRLAPVFSLLCVSSALLWLQLATDSTAYY